ncbi:hypothetical protein M0R45_019254 [Rubus argutus]|uniref:Uncharacterized protein n=1 Tax=Rubus argutus TaxID=59490 RepID=A0AAW1X4X7_RUBAR
MGCRSQVSNLCRQHGNAAKVSENTSTGSRWCLKAVATLLWERLGDAEYGLGSECGINTTPSRLTRLKGTELGLGRERRRHVTSLYLSRTHIRAFYNRRSRYNSRATHHDLGFDSSAPPHGLSIAATHNQLESDCCDFLHRSSLRHLRHHVCLSLAVFRIHFFDFNPSLWVFWVVGQEPARDEVGGNSLRNSTIEIKSVGFDVAALAWVCAYNSSDLDRVALSSDFAQSNTNTNKGYFSSLMDEADDDGDPYSYQDYGRPRGNGLYHPKGRQDSYQSVQSSRKGQYSSEY